MSDYMKEPATPDQAPQVGAKKSSAVPSVVIVILIVFVGLPIIMAIIGLIFVAANFDNITKWVDSHIEDDYPNISSYNVVDDARKESATTIYAMTVNSRVRKESGISKIDCQNMQLLAETMGHDFLDDSFCAESKEIEIASSVKSGSVVNLYLSDDKECAEFQFFSNFTKVISYRKGSVRSVCPDTKTVKLVDTGEILEPIIDFGSSKEKSDKEIKILINES